MNGARVFDLDGNPAVQKATAFLRSPRSGRLDVTQIAKLYGQPLKRFADALRVTPSDIRRAPDAQNYQAFLANFERVARILPMLKTDSFSTWSKTPSDELKGGTPAEWLFGGPRKARRLAEIVEEILVGQPD